VFVEIVRLFVAVIATAGGYWLGREIGIGREPEAIGALLGCLVGYVGGGVLGRLLLRAVGAVERRVDRAPAATVAVGSIGGVLGALVGPVITLPLLVFVPVRLLALVAGLASWVCGYAGYRIAAHQSQRLFETLGLSTRPLVRATPYSATDGLIVDTSAVMDGHLMTLTRSGIITSDLLVPQFVLDELQGLADAPETTRARRAKAGLDTLEYLRTDPSVRLFVVDDTVPEIDAVDAKLVALAKRLQLRLLTSDANLVRVAQLRDVPTTNLRVLVQDLGPAVHAGDPLELELVREGRQPGQGVGYLDDGSMVVVNGGAELVGQGTVAVEVASIVPTAAGRMVFAHPRQ